MRSSSGRNVTSRSAPPSMTNPYRQSSNQAAARTPTTIRAPPMTTIDICEKKLASRSTSPSIRSISSPGGWALWNDMSSFRTWRVRSERSRFVVRQPTSVPR